MEAICHSMIGQHGCIALLRLFHSHMNQVWALIFHYFIISHGVKRFIDTSISPQNMIFMILFSLQFLHGISFRKIIVFVCGRLGTNYYNSCPRRDTFHKFYNIYIYKDFRTFLSSLIFIKLKISNS